MKLDDYIAKLERLSNLADRVSIISLIDNLKEIKKSQKVTVPQFVADWIEKNRGSLFGLNYDSVPSEIYDWVYEEEGNLKKLHLACAIGYTVEKEKRYSVKIKGEIEENLLVYGLGINRYFFARTYDSSKRNEHTRKELEKAGFGWVLDCPGIEVEEVEG